MRENKFTIGIITLLLAVYLIVDLSQPKPINWTVTYSMEDKIPYGTFVLRAELKDLFPDQQIKDIYEPPFNHLHVNELKGTYIFFKQNFAPDKLDTKELLKFVDKGNSVFIATDNFSNEFKDTLNLDTERLTEGFMDSTSLNFIHKDLKSDTSYQYKSNSVDHYFGSFDSLNTQILGINSSDKPNFIQVKFGEGNFYLSSVPRAFTNYYMLYENNHEYIEKALSHLPNNQTIYWDEYYKVGRQESRTPLRYLLSQEALKWALWVLVIGVLLYMLFESKRKQRIIPIIEPLKNTTLEFTKTVGSLYFQRKDHKDIALKKVNYFLEFIRSNYFINTQSYNDDFIQKLAKKSGKEEEEVRVLFDLIAKIHFSQFISENTLINLHNKIEAFYH